MTIWENIYNEFIKFCLDLQNILIVEQNSRLPTKGHNSLSNHIL